jgi:hypothetical protein
MTEAILIALVMILAVAGWLLVLASIGYADYLREKRRDPMSEAAKRRRKAERLGGRNS